MQFLLFFEISVVLRQAFERQLVRRLDVLGFVDVLLLEVFNFLRVGRREESNLRGWHDSDNLFYDFFEVLGKELVDFIEDEELAGVQVGDILACEVEDPARSGDDDVDSLVKAVEVVTDFCATGADHAL